jgi:AraC-like DNA-binding protein
VKDTDVHLRLPTGVVPDVTFAWSGEVEPGRIFREHVHRSYFIDYISSGSARWERDTVPSRLTAGCAYLYNSTEVVSGAVEGKEPIVVRGVGFHWPQQWRRGAAAGFIQLPRSVKISSSGRADFEQTFDAMLRVYTRAGTNWRQAVGGYILALLGLLCTECDQIQGRAIDPRLDLAIKFMRAHFRRPLKMAEVADAASLSESYFRKTFASWQKKSPLQFLIDLRLLEARRLLAAQSGVPIRLIACKAGFGDDKHFMRLFRARYGAPPGAFRREGWHRE